MNSLYYETNAGNLHDTARLLFNQPGAAALAEFFEQGGVNGGVLNLNAFSGISGGNAYRLTLIDSTGNVLWDSEIKGSMVNHADREEIRAALEGREGSARRNSISTGMRQIYSALPVFGKNGQPAGVFRLSKIVPGFWLRIAPAALPFILLAGFFFMLAFTAILVFSHSLSAALNRLVGIAGAAILGPADGESSPDGQDVENAFHDDEAFIPGTGEAAAAATETEFLVLEKALRRMTAELNLRIERVRAESGRLEAILNSMSEAVFAMDENLILHMVNPRARELFAIAGPEGNLRPLAGLSLLEAVHSTELEDAAKTVLAENRPLELELKMHAAGGGTLGGEQHLQVFAAPLSGNSGKDKAAGLVMVVQDSTKLVKLEQVRKDFVANVSHELRTPIHLIKGFSETLLDSSLEENKEQVRHFMEIIHKNAARMESLVKDLLTLSSIESGSSGRLVMDNEEIAPLFADAVSAVELQAKKKNIEITTDCPAGMYAHVYGAYIVQALINLLDNAIKYSPDNSRIRAKAFYEKEALTLEVRDEGAGIPQEHLDRIFERFYRVDRAHSRESGGTGLGLSIVRHIALLHNGTVKAESRAGEGSVFRMWIPNVKNRQAE